MVLFVQKLYFENNGYRQQIFLLYVFTASERLLPSQVPNHNEIEENRYDSQRVVRECVHCDVFKPPVVTLTSLTTWRPSFWTPPQSGKNSENALVFMALCLVQTLHSQ